MENLEVYGPITNNGSGNSEINTFVSIYAMNTHSESIRMIEINNIKVSEEIE